MRKNLKNFSNKNFSFGKLIFCHKNKNFTENGLYGVFEVDKDDKNIDFNRFRQVFPEIEFFFFFWSELQEKNAFFPIFNT